MKKTVLVYGLGVALGASALRWLEYRYTVRLLSIEIYVTLVAVAFTLFGLWLGRRLTERTAPGPFEANTRALAELGISEREHEVLRLLAEGHSNGEIAARLFVSPNTVKTHLARVYEKLEVNRRTQAVSRAKALRLVP